MLRRNLLYTAITRAERVCVLVGTKSALQQAVRKQDERRRSRAWQRGYTSTDPSVMDESVKHPDRGPEDDHRNESRDQSRAKRPPRGESMHFGDTVQHDDTAPYCQHAFNDADLVKRRIDLEHLGCRRMRYCDALKDREQQDDLGGDRRNVPPGQGGPHFDPARDAA